jgi:hypothetical protein
MITNTTNEKRIVTNEDLYNLILNQNDVITRNKDELLDMMSNQHDMIVDSFDRFFNVMDETNKELKLELKNEISGLRTDMNQRFLAVDKRLLSIETDMVHKYEFNPLVKRVELLEARL